MHIYILWLLSTGHVCWNWGDENQLKINRNRIHVQVFLSSSILFVSLFPYMYLEFIKFYQNVSICTCACKGPRICWNREPPTAKQAPLSATSIHLYSISVINYRTWSALFYRVLWFPSRKFIWPTWPWEWFLSRWVFLY